MTVCRYAAVRHVKPKSSSDGCNLPPATAASPQPSFCRVSRACRVLPKRQRARTAAGAADSQDKTAVHERKAPHGAWGESSRELLVRNLLESIRLASCFLVGDPAIGAGAK